MNQENIAILIPLLATFAFMVEAVVEHIFASWLWKGDESKADLRQLVLQLTASLVGVLICVVYGIDLLQATTNFFEQPAALESVAPWVGRILTGILIGRGGQWFHDFGGLFGLDG